MEKSCFVGISALRRNDPDRPIHDKDFMSSTGDVQKTPQDSLLSVIYAPDARTGLPTGDIQYYVSDRASEDVKQFILQNLLKDVSVAKNVANPQGLSDDALLELSRGLNESVDDYVLRMQRQIDDFKFIREQVAKEQVARQVAAQNVPSKSE